MKAFAYVGIFENVLKLLIVYIIALSAFDKLVFYSFLLACVAISERIIYGIYVRHHFRECICIYKFDWQKGKSIFSFVSWNLLGASAQIGKEQGLNVLLNLFFGASVNASRGIAYQDTKAVSQIEGNFHIAMNPQNGKL